MKNPIASPGKQRESCKTNGPFPTKELRQSENIPAKKCHLYRNTRHTHGVSVCLHRIEMDWRFAQAVRAGAAALKTTTVVINTKPRSVRHLRVMVGRSVLGQSTYGRGKHEEGPGGKTIIATLGNKSTMAPKIPKQSCDSSFPAVPGGDTRVSPLTVVSLTLSLARNSSGLVLWHRRVGQRQGSTPAVS